MDSYICSAFGNTQCMATVNSGARCSQRATCGMYCATHNKMYGSTTLASVSASYSVGGYEMNTSEVVYYSTEAIWWNVANTSHTLRPEDYY